MGVGGVAGAGLHCPCSFLPKSFWRNTPLGLGSQSPLCGPHHGNPWAEPAQHVLPPPTFTGSVGAGCNGCRAPWSPRKEAPAPTWAVSPSFSLQLTPLLPSLGFMTCFMSPAWRLPRCHGNQPGAGSWQRNLRLAILSQKPILRKRWGGASKGWGLWDPKDAWCLPAPSALSQFPYATILRDFTPGRLWSCWSPGGAWSWLGNDKGN